MSRDEASRLALAVVPSLRWLSALGTVSCLVVLAHPAPWSVFGFMVAGQFLVAIPALAIVALVIWQAASAHGHVRRAHPPREP